MHEFNLSWQLHVFVVVGVLLHDCIQTLAGNDPADSRLESAGSYSRDLKLRSVYIYGQLSIRSKVKVLTMQYHV